MGKGHLNTKPEHDRMCKAFLKILDILDSGKCVGFSSSEWLTPKDVGNDKAEPSLDSGIPVFSTYSTPNASQAAFAAFMKFLS